MCSGNTCRSPLAEEIAKKILPVSFPEKLVISSAGSSALEGLPASTLAVEVADKHDIDLSNHRTRFLNRSIVLESDLIVAMSSKHKETVGVIEPRALGYTFLLTDFCDGLSGEIPDPIGSGIESYEQTYRLIEECVEQMGEKLKTFNQWAK